MRHISKDPNISPEELKKVRNFYLLFLFLLFLYVLGWTLLYSIYDALVIMGLAFFGLVPAFITNALMPLVSNIKFIKRYPMDFGKYHPDGNRILGDGKTWNGFIGGTLLGFIISVFLAIKIYPIIAYQTQINFADGQTVLKFVTEKDILFFVESSTDPHTFYWRQFLLCLGTPLGDAIGSYFKRRKKLKRGEIFLFWDQNDFIICSIIISYFFFPLAWYYVLFLLLVTPLITITANIIGYYLGKKEVPW